MNREWVTKAIVVLAAGWTVSAFAATSISGGIGFDGLLAVDSPDLLGVTTLTDIGAWMVASGSSGPSGQYAADLNGVFVSDVRFHGGVPLRFTIESPNLPFMVYSFSSVVQGDLVNYSMVNRTFTHSLQILNGGTKWLILSGTGTAFIKNAVTGLDMFTPTTGQWTLQGLQVGTSTITWSMNTFAVPGMDPVLQITRQPQDQLGYWGKTASFSVVATNFVPPVGFQWFRNGLPLVGATHSALSLINLVAADAGGYSVVVSDASGGQLTSRSAALTVQPAGVGISLAQEAGATLYVGMIIEGVVQRIYGIQATTNLNNAQGWFGVTNLTLTTPTMLWRDSQPANQPQRYYRVVPGPISVP